MASRLLTKPMDFINHFTINKGHTGNPLISRMLKKHVNSKIIGSLYHVYCTGSCEYIVLIDSDTDMAYTGMLPMDEGVIYYGIVPKSWTQNLENNDDILTSDVIFNMALPEVRGFIFPFITNVVGMLINNPIAIDKNYPVRLAFLVLSSMISKYYSFFDQDEYYHTCICPELFKLQERYDIRYGVDKLIFDPDKSICNEASDITPYTWNTITRENVKKKYPVPIYSLHGDQDIICKFNDVLGKAMEYIDIMHPGNKTMSEILSDRLNNPEEDDICVIILSNNDIENKNAIIINDNLSDAEIHLSTIDDGKTLITVKPHDGNNFEMDVNLDDDMAPYHLMSLNPAVKDAFNAMHKNGVPTTIEEYRIRPMGNPVPIIVDEPMKNEIVVK